MMDLLINLCYFALGYWLCSVLFSLRLKSAIKRIAKENNIDLDEPIVKVKAIPVLITEPVDGGFLLYDAKHNFMCQGKSLDEVAENLLKYKNVKLAMIVHEQDKFWCVEGKVKSNEG